MYLLYTVSRLLIRAVLCCHLEFFVYSEWCSTYSGQRNLSLSFRLQEVKSVPLKTVKLLGKKVVAVGHERWLFTRGSKYRALTGKIKGVLK